MIGAMSGYAQTNTLKFENTSPDIILQMNLNNYSSSYLLNRINDVAKKVKGIDLYDQSFNLPSFPIHSHSDGVADYVVGELGEMLARVIDGNLVGARTSLNIYNFGYKLGKPRVALTFTEVKDNHIDFVFNFSSNKLEIDVDAVYLNNHSQGVRTERSFESGESRSRIFNPELRTVLDDIYLKIESPKDRALLIIDGNKGRRDNPLAVISGEIKVRIIAKEDGTLTFKFVDYSVGLFGSKSAKDFSHYIDLAVGPKTGIGGLQSVEYGSNELRLLDHNLSEVVLERKTMLAELLAGPIIDQIYNPKTKAMISKKIDGFVVDPRFEKNIESLNYTLKTKVNEFGVVKSRSTSEKVVSMYGISEQNQFRVGIDVDLINNNNSDYKWTPPYKMKSSDNINASNDFIFEEIASDRSGLIISIDQEFINHSINSYVDDKGKELLEGVAPSFISIGSKGAFLMLDDTNQGKVVVDILAREKFFKRMLMTVGIGRGKINFPCVIIPEITVKMIDDIPNLIIKIKDVDLAEETLRNGIYGVESNLKKGWLKKTVIKLIKTELSAMIGSELAKVPLTQLKGLPVDKIVKLQADGNGRLNLMVDISPFSEASREVFKKLPLVISNLMSKKAIE